MEFSRVHFSQVSSTLDVAADPTYAHGTVITADSQSAGRGQRGNKWHSLAGENLMLTLVLCPTHIRVDEQFVLSMATALAVVDAIGEFGVVAKVKWPNDIYVAQRKITGILIEHSFSSEMLDRTLVGVGINVCQSRFDPALPNPTSLMVEGVSGVTPQSVLREFERAFARRYASSAKELHKAYMTKLYRADGFYSYRDQEGLFEGRIVGVDPLGGVISIEDRTGRVRSYYFKEVEYII